MAEKYDVVIVGSGIGGLSAGVILTKVFGKKVLILERHFKPGGFTHIFKRKGKYEWDIGLHYVGQMENNDMPGKFMNFITGGAVKWNKMPEVYDKAIFPDFTFEAKAGKENLRSDLVSLFPREKENIDKYFADIEKALKWMQKYQIFLTLGSFTNRLFGFVKNRGSELALQTTKEYLDKNFSDPKLKAILSYQFGAYGLPPSKSAFILHAMITDHYFEGGYYPAEGSKSLSDSAIAAIEKNGGKVLINHEVTEIIIRHNRAVGVKAIESKGNDKIEKEIYGDYIISDAGAEITYNKLLPASRYNKYRKMVNRFDYDTATCVLYIGFKDDPATLGFQGSNYCIFDSMDFENIYNTRSTTAQGIIRQAYVTFPSVKKKNPGGHTGEIIIFTDPAEFKKWENQPWKNRDEEYVALKEKISEAIISLMEERNPGFRDLIDYHELSTPLSTEHFTGYKNGNIYGIPGTPERYKSEVVGYRTPVKNLYLAGSDSAGHGIVGAMMGGVLSVAVAEGITFSMGKIFKAINKAAKV